METQENVVMGAKSDRRIHLVSSSKLAKVVYTWLETEDARNSLKATDSAVETTLVIGWYAKSGTSGLTETIMNNFKTALEAYLTEQGFNLDNITITIKDYDGKVAEVQTAVLADNNVDIMLGMKAFTLTDSEGKELIKETQDDVTMGAQTGRRIHRVSDSALGNFVFEWLKSSAARDSFKTPTAES
jgi:hypothetical protein